jgi:quercetin dioxygenase-like cupin family protein
MMNTRIKLATAFLILVSITAWATPGSGFLFNIILNRAQVPDPLHSDAVGEAADGSKWHIQLKSEGAPSDFVVQDVALAPGGYSGWHSHPGPVLVTVKEGTATEYDADCVVHTYTTGTAFVEDANSVHNVRNESANENLRLVATYIIPTGVKTRNEESAPAQCSFIP